MQELNNDIKNYLQIAKTGHYPLFFQNWLTESVKHNEPLTYRIATRNVQEVFQKLSRHQSSERKKTALIQLDEKERNRFIQSFFRVVEHDLLKDLKSLH
jgi:hypothetical protein